MDQPGTSQQGQEDIIAEDLSNSDTEFASKQLLQIFFKLKKAIEEHDLAIFKKLVNILHTVDDKVLIQQCVCINDIDLFCLISKHSQLEMLLYLFDQTQLLPYLSPLDKAQRNRNIEASFFNCMYNVDTTLLEKFYDYWAGDLHWVFNKASSINDNENLSNLCILLDNAVDKFQNSSVIKSCDPQKFADIRCILTFNEFQIQLYEKLNEVKEKINEWEDISDYDKSICREIEAIKEIIEIIFDLHEKYSKEVIDKALEMQQLDDNDITFYWKANSFYMYKTFFWKIDYNVCLLLLDNIYLLKRRLIMQDNMYQTLESKLYHFIYHFKSKWAFYLSKTGTVEGGVISTMENSDSHIIYETPFTLDVGAMIRFLIMYLEREHFIEILRNFKGELKRPILFENIRPKDSKLTDEEIQSLMPFPEMRDDFSLKKMLRYLQELPLVSDIKMKKEWAQLLLERILQVVGEFLKSTKESLHLESTTQSLIMAEIPIDIVKSLSNIRNYLSKAKDSQILWRMEIAKHGEDVFEKILQDLLNVRNAIKKVVSINRYLVNRSLIKFGFKILNARNEYIKENINIPDYMYCSFSIFLGGVLHHQFGKMLIDDFYNNKWSKHGLSKCLMLEVGQIHHDFNMLQKKFCQEMKRIQEFLVKNFLHYKKVINELLQKILFQKINWTDMKITLSTTAPDVTIRDYPNIEDMCDLKTYLNCINTDGELINIIGFINKYTDVEPMWDLIERLFEFLIMKTKTFDETNAELKFSMFTYYYGKLCKNGYKEQDLEDNVKMLLKLIEDHCAPKVQSSNRSHIFNGIMEFEEILNMKQFVTEDEIQYILKNIPESCKDKDQIVNNIGNNFFADMDKNIKTILSIEPFDILSEKIIRSVNAFDRDPELLKCYLKRITLLSSIIDGQPRDFLVVQYKYNVQFRIWLEMILIDLLNISHKCKRVETLQKQNKFLTEINIRNVLAHGSPLLEVIGNVLDANDLPGEIINKSLEFIDDLESVQALIDLKNIGFSFENIDKIEYYKNMNDNEKKLIDTFKRSKHWRSYLQLIPEYVEYVWSETKKIIELEKKRKMELIEAIRTKEAIDNINSIIERVNIDIVDEFGNAAIHYAAMNGNVDVLKKLFEKKANINIKNKDNEMTALHYAALKGQSDAVNYLITAGANIDKDKYGNTYRDIEDNQAQISKKRMEEKPQELEFEADDFKLFDMDD